MEIGENGEAVVSSKWFREHWSHVNMRSVNERWMRLVEHVRTQTLPPRDYSLQWTNERIVHEFP